MRIWYVAYVAAWLWNRFRGFPCFSVGKDPSWRDLDPFPTWGCSLDGVFCLSTMQLCIVLALPQMILIISWLLGKNCGLVDSQFSIFHRWFEWLFIDPNPLITLYEKRNKVCSDEHTFVHLSSSSNRFEKSKDQDSTCMVEVSGMITTFDYVAALIALLVSECPEGASIKAVTGSCFGWFYPFGLLMFPDLPEVFLYKFFMWTWCTWKKENMRCIGMQ